MPANPEITRPRAETERLNSLRKMVAQKRTSVRAQESEGDRRASVAGLLAAAQPTISRQGTLIMLDCPDGAITDDLFDALELASGAVEAP